MRDSHLEVHDQRLAKGQDGSMFRLLPLLLCAASAASAQDLPSAEPRYGELKQSIQALLDGIVAKGITSASAGIVLPDGEVLAVVAGTADPETRRELLPTDMFLVGSTGKTYVTGIVHLLEAEGWLDFDSTAASYFAEDEDDSWLDDLPNGREVTLRQLLRHQTGIPRYVFGEEFTSTLTSQPDRVWTPKELLAFANRDALFAPGEKWAYSDTNYILLGMVVEKATGQTFYDLVRTRLLDPHGLRETVPTNRRRIERMAQGHVVMGRSMGVGEWALQEGQFSYNVQFEWCGGGWATTPSDLARWVGLLYGGRAFDEEYLGTLLDTVPAGGLGRGVGYGMGVMVRETKAGELRYHDGFMPGYTTSAGLFPASNIAVAIQLGSDNGRAVGKPLSMLLAELAVLANAAFDK
ncbi:MAG: D-alanyl-D-alanine carboxypeptidase [Planctomycetota bacterium]